MTEQQTHRLSDVITRIRTIAHESYEDKVYDNILNIFADLNISEQRVLLKGLINICFIIQDQVLENSTNIANNSKQIENNKHNIEVVKHDVNGLQDEINTIDTYNRLELIKLKSWFVKAIIIFTILLSFGFLLIVYFLDGGSELSETTSDVFEILKTLIK